MLQDSKKSEKKVEKKVEKTEKKPKKEPKDASKNVMREVRIRKLCLNICVGESGDRLTRAAKVSFLTIIHIIFTSFLALKRLLIVSNKSFVYYSYCIFCRY